MNSTPKYPKWYSVTLYVTGMLETTYLLKGLSHEDVREFVLTSAISMPEFVGKELGAESMRVKDRHLSVRSADGFRR